MVWVVTEYPLYEPVDVTVPADSMSSISFCVLSQYLVVAEPFGVAGDEGEYVVVVVQV